MSVRHYMDFVDIKPTALSIEISTKCTLSCKYCSRKDKGTDMSLDQMHQLKHHLKKIPNLKRLSFCGIGETLLNPDFYTMLGELKEYLFLLVTSGTIPVDFERLNQHGNLEMLVFSIDATNENSIKELCGKTFNYDNLMDNLERFRTYSKKHKLNRLIDLMNATINPRNIDEIENLMDFAIKYNFRYVHYSLQWGDEEFIIRNLPTLKKSFQKVRRKARRHGIYTDNPFKSYCCINNDSLMAMMSLNGDFFPCCYALNQAKPAGNLYRQTFEEMWEGDAYREFRTGKLCETCYMPRMTAISNGSITLDDIKQSQAQVQQKVAS